jgi:hypothetical protein
MRQLMTQSLLSSWLYMFKAPPFEVDEIEHAEKARDSFLSVLRREAREPSKAMLAGREFEELVYKAAWDGADESHAWIGAARKISEVVKGGQFQVKASKDLLVAGMDIVLYGVLDCLKAGVVYDIKYTGKYDVGKFLNSPQHPAYMELVPEAEKFVYLVSNGRSIWREAYSRTETPSIVPIIEDFFCWLEANELMGTYMEKWATKYR